MASPTIVASVCRFLSAHPPFSQMDPEHLEFVATNVELAYYRNAEILLSPGSGASEHCFIVKQGIVEGLRPEPGQTGDAEGEAMRSVLQLAAGEVFPVAALLAARSVITTYRAAGDTFCWLLPRAKFDELTERSPVFLKFCRSRLSSLLDLSDRAVQASYATQIAQRREMDATLASVARREPVTSAPNDTIRSVFEAMERRSVGSVVIVDPNEQGEGGTAVRGIFTRQDVIGRVVLPGVSLDTPITEVMTSPVASLAADATVADAMLLMAERSIRHIPVTGSGRLVGIVTERDLFVMLRRSLSQIGDDIRKTFDARQMPRVAEDIRAWSRSLVAQGVSAAFVTQLISRLNDQVTVRLIDLIARERGVDLNAICWLALGSEGREEQTIATDQDNGLILARTLEASRDEILEFALQVNRSLDACGYPLCKGGIMASNPKWCLDESQWRGLFDDWIARGDPQSLLHSSIFFDFRALAGRDEFARSLRAHVATAARANSRFLKQMSDNALRNRPPSSWAAGVIDYLFTSEGAGIDLKMRGAVPFVDGARLLSLAHGVHETGTAERFAALAETGAIPLQEARSWTDAFQFVQGLRLRVQHGQAGSAANPNTIDTRQLSALDRRVLKEAFQQAHLLQRRLALDYPG
ncbi:MAG: CBS domain-containing protein [Burkholderiaceae bacterium]|nr:CBS domain-containing protein [Burkholderiaceae bacterium]